MSSFDPKEAETDGVETRNHCEINVDVAEMGSECWTLKSEKDAHTQIAGTAFFNLCLNCLHLQSLSGTAQRMLQGKCYIQQQTLQTNEVVLQNMLYAL